jgi:hypothetical protein
MKICRKAVNRGGEEQKYGGINLKIKRRLFLTGKGEHSRYSS